MSQLIAPLMTFTARTCLIVLLTFPSIQSAFGRGIQSYDPSFIGFTHRYGNDRELDDSLRVNLSLRYEFENKPSLLGSTGVYTTLNLAYDFYWGVSDRESAPVIGRVFNPGIHFRQFVKQLNSTDSDNVRDDELERYVEFSLHHRSNGQTIAVDDPDDPVRAAELVEQAQQAYEQGDFEYIDAVSRSSNYIQFEAQYIFKQLQSTRFKFRVIPYYWSLESDVPWSSRKGHFAEYETVSMLTEYKNNDFGLHSHYRVGKGGFKTDSLDLGIQYDLGNFPLVARLHFGPMETLSDHTRSVSSVMLGIVFTDL